MPGGAECVADVRAKLGEGPVWLAAEQALYWVDILGQTVFRWHEAEGLRTIPVERPVCSLMPRTGGGFIGGGYDGVIAVDADFAVTPLVSPEPELSGNRFNDAKIDRAGRLWAGTMDRKEREASGSLYRMGNHLAWERIDSGYRVTNGPAFSRDGRVLYHTDSAIQTVYAFDLADDGSVGSRRVHLTFGEGDGYPDGMTVDAEDCLWIAFWDGWCVRRFAPSGELLATIDLPVQRPTSVAFGGAGLDELFVTSAARGLTEADFAQQPQAGGLFRLRPGVTGIAELPFAG
jgi:sugar lactone lactonase YvrE